MFIKINKPEKNGTFFLQMRKVAFYIKTPKQPKLVPDYSQDEKHF